MVLLDPQKSPALSSQPSGVHNFFFEISTPIFEAPETSQLFIINKQFPEYFAQSPLRCFNPSSPLLESLISLDTGVQSLGYLPLSVGSTSKHTIALEISNLPTGISEANLTLKSQFEATLEYGTFSSSPVTIVITVHSHEEVGVKYGMVGYSPNSPAGCNVSCCSDSSCEEKTKCGVDYMYSCFALNFFNDSMIEVLSIDNTQG
jgi:hypothetical protein